MCVKYSGSHFRLQGPSIVSTSAQRETSKCVGDDDDGNDDDEAADAEGIGLHMGST